ncbi:MAG: hypothetical protein RJB11_3196 [Planctomycetota bacterium]
MSRGQRAGVSLALILSNLPELVILDDSALGLDPVNGRIAVDCPLESLVHRVSNCTVELDDDTTEIG